MAKKHAQRKAVRPAAREEDVATPKTSAIAILTFGEVGTKIIERFGWPGSLLVAGSWFVETHASTEQKQAIIDQYILGKGLTDWYSQLVLLVLAVLVFWAQGKYWRTKWGTERAEVERLSALKSKKQSEKLGTNAHSSKSG